jgi:hypothetical protein
MLLPLALQVNVLAEQPRKPAMMCVQPLVILLPRVDLSRRCTQYTSCALKVTSWCTKALTVRCN